MPSVPGAMTGRARTGSRRGRGPRSTRCRRARVSARRDPGLGAGAVHATIDDAHAATPLTAALIATPPQHHALPCRAALELGLGVLVEKPFTQDLAEAVELVDLAEAAAVPLLVAQSYRHLRVHRAVRD